MQWARHQDRWFGKWHVYLGIIAGLIVAVVGLTGSILVFEDEIDVALNKSYFMVEQQQQKIPIEKVIPIVGGKYPDLKFSYAINCCSIQGLRSSDNYIPIIFSQALTN